VANYDITASLADPDSKLGNYTVTLNKGTLTINKAVLTVKAPSTSRSYGNSNPTLSPAITGFVNNDSPSAVSGSAPCTTTALLSSPIGDYPTECQAGSTLSATNYSFTYVTGTLSVVKAALTVTPADATRVYGDANPLLSGSVVGVTNGDSITASYATVATAGSGVATYDITATLNDPGGKLGNYTVTLNKGTLSVTAAPLSVHVNSVSREYGESNPTFTGTVTGIKNGDSITATYASSATAVSPVGPYAIVATLVDPGSKLGNYSVTAPDGALTVTKAPLTVTPANKQKTYGDANPTLTGSITGVKNSDNITASYATAATGSSDVANYDITASLADPDSKLGNYTVTLNKGTLTINRAALTITTDASSKIYGSANPTFTVSYSGFTLGQDKAVLAGTLAFITSATAASHVGSYSVTPSGLASGNYLISFVPGTLQVQTAPLTITADTKSKVYGTANPVLTASYSGFVNGDDSGKLTGVVSLATAAVQYSHVGSYDIVPSGVSSSDYTIAFKKGTLSITSAAATVTADNKSMSYGGTLPALTATYGGLVNGDTIAGVTITTTASSTSAGGTYPITAAGPASTTDYTVTYYPGTLAIGYRFSGFLQPINDTAINPALTPSVFKQGSTIPIKFQLLDANGNPVPASLAASIASSCSATVTMSYVTTGSSPVDETVSSDTANTGTCFRYDSTSNQFIFNMSTKPYRTNSTYQIGAKIVGGAATVSQGSVQVGLR
jgi:hypothetical protein